MQNDGLICSVKFMLPPSGQYAEKLSRLLSRSIVFLVTSTFDQQNMKLLILLTLRTAITVVHIALVAIVNSMNCCCYSINSRNIVCTNIRNKIMSNNRLVLTTFSRTIEVNTVKEVLRNPCRTSSYS